jgi:hypothetical protein
MVLKGVKHAEELREIYPDMGYSFCNCKDIFYSRHEDVRNDVGLQSDKDPLGRLSSDFKTMKSGEILSITMHDIFFVEWGKDPHMFLGWDPRTNFILWNMEVLCDEAEAIGFEVVSAERNFEIGTGNPQTFKMELKKP